MRTRTLLPAALLGAAVIFTTSGCDLFGGGGLDPNTYTINAEGADDGEQTGAAFGTGDNTDGDEVFALALGGDLNLDTISEPAVAFVGLNTDQPEEGSVTLTAFDGETTPGNGDVIAVYLVPGETSSDFPTFYVGLSGRLRVTDVAEDGDQMEGSYSFVAVSVNLLSGELGDDEITVRGEFNAERDDDILDDLNTLQAPGSVMSALRQLRVTRN